MCDWTNINDEAPPKQGHYLVTSNLNMYNGGCREESELGGSRSIVVAYFDICGEWNVPFVTHWMPLPEPPAQTGTNVVKNNKEKVLCAAIWVKTGEKAVFSPVNIDKGFVVAGWRHGSCLAVLKATNMKVGLSQIEQGFLTSHNRFLDRKAAREFVLQTGQLKETEFGDELYSEDLY